MDSWGDKQCAEFLAHAPEYEATGKVRARRLEEARTWRTEHGDLLRADAGDWLLQDAAGEDQRQWSVKDEIFRATYVPCGEGVYRKSARITARQLTHPVTIATLEGDSTAAAGDWLAANRTGEFWPIPQAEFARKYQPA